MSQRSRNGFVVVVAVVAAWLLTTLVAGCIDVDGFFPDPVRLRGFPEDASASNRTKGDASGSFPQDAGTEADADGRPGATPDDPPLDAFNVASVVSTSATTVSVTFSAPPNPAQALVLASYEVRGLTFDGPPALEGNVVTLTTLAQSASTYTLTVSGVTRATDAEPLFQSSATFQGRAPFNVVDARPQSAIYLAVTFDAEPNAAEAAILSNYDVPGLELISAGALPASKTVLLRTPPQQSTKYSVKVTGVTRASDGERLAVARAEFTGKGGSFNVVSAQSTGNQSMTMTFDAPPNAIKALDPDSYWVSGLSVAPLSVAGNVVTFATGPQMARTYQLMVFGVTRASDGEPLSNSDWSFEGRTALP